MKHPFIFAFIGNLSLSEISLMLISALILFMGVLVTNIIAKKAGFVFKGSVVLFSIIGFFVTGWAAQFLFFLLGQDRAAPQTDMILAQSKKYEYQSMSSCLAENVFLKVPESTDTSCIASVKEIDYSDFKLLWNAFFVNYVADCDSSHLQGKIYKGPNRLQLEQEMLAREIITNATLSLLDSAANEFVKKGTLKLGQTTFDYPMYRERMLIPNYYYDSEQKFGLKIFRD